MITPNPRVALLAASLLLTGCGVGAAAQTAAAPTPTARTPQPAISLDVAPQQIPGLGPKTWAEVPADTRQAVVVTGRGRNSPRSTAVLYERTDAGWEAGRPWPAHNGQQGWTDHHVLGDLRTPIGVHTLSDAGGLLRDPGTRLPYDRSTGFTLTGTGFEGEPLAGSFDYVIAIDYNRRPGTSPLDWTRPLGAERGGGIWLHVDHGGPTQGCVSIARAHMKDLLLALDPAKNPVVVMGDAKSLAR
ncbi:L,D-transpeptidase family protein [Streptomyces sp. CC219B]|uniref:L,D-transpeptidase family protein n=1 Tax=Streptomyces sp. CC219B TaxID=3044574 RepID=UPI0024A9D789|nr:L,D-transpeptidase family protein [Streptomyces sp. CC219B]